MNAAPGIQGVRANENRGINLPALAFLLPLLILATLGMRWHLAERLVLDVSREIEAGPAPTVAAWEDQSERLTRALALRPANVPALQAHSGLWLQRRAVPDNAGMEDPLAAWFLLHEVSAAASLQVTRQATRLRPSDPAAWVNLALRKLQEGEVDDELRFAVDQVLRFGSGNATARLNLTLMMATYPVTFIADSALLALAHEHLYLELAPNATNISRHLGILNNSRNLKLWCRYLEQEKLADAMQRMCQRT